MSLVMTVPTDLYTTEANSTFISWFPILISPEKYFSSTLVPLSMVPSWFISKITNRIINSRVDRPGTSVPGHFYIKNKVFSFSKKYKF